MLNSKDYLVTRPENILQTEDISGEPFLLYKERETTALTGAGIPKQLVPLFTSHHILPRQALLLPAERVGTGVSERQGAGVWWGAVGWGDPYEMDALKLHLLPQHFSKSFSSALPASPKSLDLCGRS